jgi:hypothetical protein
MLRHMAEIASGGLKSALCMGDALARGPVLGQGAFLNLTPG